MYEPQKFDYVVLQNDWNLKQLQTIIILVITCNFWLWFVLVDSWMNDESGASYFILTFNLRARTTWPFFTCGTRIKAYEWWTEQLLYNCMHITSIRKWAAFKNQIQPCTGTAVLHNISLFFGFGELPAWEEERLMGTQADLKSGKLSSCRNLDHCH